MFSKLSFKRPILLAMILVLLVAIIGTGFSVFKAQTAHADTTSLSKFQVKVLVFTMFSDETQPWLNNEKWPLTFTVPGAFSKVYCQTNGLCLTTTGEAKSNAGPSATAILLNSQFSFQNTYFLTSGIAGTSPNVGTLGFAAWARWVVDWDLGNHLDPDTVPDVPYGWEPNTAYGTAVYHLNETLTNLAYNVTKNVPLQDDSTAIAARQNYPGQENQHPYVTRCDTITGDDFWAGQRLSAEAQYITSTLTNNQGTYCTGEQEDTAVATVLQRTGHLDHYLNLRTASDFDQPYNGESMQDLLSTYPGGNIAIANAYLVGSKMAHYLLTCNG
jgi:purine nucleoside permease